MSAVGHVLPRAFLHGSRRQHDEAFHPGLRRIRRHGSRRIARRADRHLLDAVLLGQRRSHRGKAILIGAGRVQRFVFQIQILHAVKRAQTIRMDQRGVALAHRHRLSVLRNREEIAVAPDSIFASLAQHIAQMLGILFKIDRTFNRRAAVGADIVVLRADIRLMANGTSHHRSHSSVIAVCSNEFAAADDLCRMRERLDMGERIFFQCH